MVDVPALAFGNLAPWGAVFWHSFTDGECKPCERHTLAEVSLGWGSACRGRFSALILYARPSSGMKSPCGDAATRKRHEQMTNCREN